MFHKLIRSPNAKKLSTLFCGLHFYPTKTTIKLNQNKILGLLNLSGISKINGCLVDFPNTILPTPTFPKDLALENKDASNFILENHRTFNGALETIMVHQNHEILFFFNLWVNLWKKFHGHFQHSPKISTLPEKKEGGNPMFTAVSIPYTLPCVKGCQQGWWLTG